jgi:O-antigen/teichoic acid export membrane protein
VRRPLGRTFQHLGYMWVVQVLTIVLQVVYLSVVSRMVMPSDFGAFAVAVLITILGNLIAQSGLAQAAARRPDADESGDGALLSVAILVGVITAVTTSLTAPLWARLWDNSASAPLIILLSVAMPFLAVSGVQSGILRRQARIRSLGSVQFAAAVSGMVVGALLVVRFRSAWALCISPVATAIVTAAVLAVILGRAGRPRGVSRDARADVSFSAKSTLKGVLTYVGFGLPQWVASVHLGPTTFGNWNRAIAVGQVPVESVMRSVQTVMFPRFRDHRPQDAGVSRYWSNMLGASALMLLPACALVLPVVPMVTLFVLGPQWDVASQMTPWVLAAAVLTLHSSLLTMALESSAHFRQLWLGQFASMVVLAIAAALIWTTGEWLPLAVSFPAAAIAAHGVQLVSAGRRGLLDLGRVAARYLAITGVSLVAFLESYLVVQVSPAPALSLANCLVLVVLFGYFAFRARDRQGLDPRTW